MLYNLWEDVDRAGKGFLFGAAVTAGDFVGATCEILSTDFAAESANMIS